MQVKNSDNLKQIYETQLNEVLNKSEVGKRDFLQFQEKAQKYETIANRLKEYEEETKKLNDDIFNFTKQRQDYVNQINKWKGKVDERQGKWKQFKSMESQFDYYRSQCEKFEKANKKYEQQYYALRQYAQNVETLIGKKPKITSD